MGKSVANAYPVAKATFSEADAILKTDFSKLIFDGPEADLNDTYNTQAALFVTSVATLRALQQEVPEAVPAFTAGHSLGEFTALVSAGALNFADGLRLVRARGRLMREAGEHNPGGMGAVLGLGVEQVTAICEQSASETGGAIVIANDNCPGQVVISGRGEAVDRALELAKETGAKRALRLALSVAAHSPLMASAAEAFRAELTQVRFSAPRHPIYGNVSAAPLPTPQAIVDELEAQIMAPVRWTASVQAMIADGVTTFVEIGAGEVLSGLIKRIDHSATRVTVKDEPSLKAFVESI